jgi:hypothetical protein
MSVITTSSQIKLARGQLQNTKMRAEYTGCFRPDVPHFLIHPKLMPAGKQPVTPYETQN